MRLARAIGGRSSHRSTIDGLRGQRHEPHRICTPVLKATSAPFKATIAHASLAIRRGMDVCMYVLVRFYLTETSP